MKNKGWDKFAGSQGEGAVSASLKGWAERLLLIIRVRPQVILEELASWGHVDDRAGIHGTTELVPITCWGWYSAETQGSKLLFSQMSWRFLCVCHFPLKDQFIKSAAGQHGPDLHPGTLKRASHRGKDKTDTGSNSSSTTWPSCFHFLSQSCRRWVWNNSPNFVLAESDWDNAKSTHSLTQRKLLVKATK